MVMLSDRGRRILIEERGIHPRFLQKEIRMFERSLQVGEWLKKSSFRRSHATNPAKMAVPIDEYVKHINETCAREGLGPLIVKNHLLLHFPQLIHMYGPPNGWDSGPPEELHKHFSKLPGKLTQRRQSRFQKQLADRTEEIDIICAMIGEYIQMTQPFVNAEMPTIAMQDGGSRFKLGLDDHGRGCIRWNLKRNQRKPSHFPQVIDYACTTILDHIDGDYVCGFTEYKTTVNGGTALFRAHPSFNSESGQRCNMWYDWAKFRYENDVITPGRIFMFLSISGLNRNLQGPTGGIIIEPSEEDILVAVVQMFSSPPTKHFRQSLVDDGPYSTMVEYGRIKPTLELIPCDRIVGTALIVPNIGYQLDRQNVTDDNTANNKKQKKKKTPSRARDSEPLGRQAALDSNPTDKEEDIPGNVIADGYFVIGSREEWASVMDSLVEVADPDADVGDDIVFHQLNE